MAARSDSGSRFARSTAQAGLTISELLIYLFLGGVLTAAAASLVVSHVRTSRNLELRQRAVDLYGRINHLLQLEISEGTEIAYDTPLPDDCGDGTPLFSITVPSPLSTILAPIPPAEIHYYTQSGNDLWRCGPSVDAEGSVFDPDTGQPLPPFDALVSANAQLELLPAGIPSGQRDPRAIRYQILFTGPDGQQQVLQRGSEDQPLISRTMHRIPPLDPPLASP